MRLKGGRLAFPPGVPVQIFALQKLELVDIAIIGGWPRELSTALPLLTQLGLSSCYDLIEGANDRVALPTLPIGSLR